MQRRLQLAWRNVDPSDAIAARIEGEVGHLERLFDRITGCRVTLEAPSRHHRHSGAQYRVRIEIALPGESLLVARAPPLSRDHADAYYSVREAFREARRQLRDHARRAGERVKAHVPAPLAAVAWIFPLDGYGFLRTAEGRGIYFHENAVLGRGFRGLRPGSVVRFVEEPGESGPQASTVVPLGRGGEARPGA